MKRTEEIDGDVCNETEKAWIFIPEGWAENEAIPLPKSLCTWDEERFVMTVPRWLCDKHSLG